MEACPVPEVCHSAESPFLYFQITSLTSRQRMKHNNQVKNYDIFLSWNFILNTGNDVNVFLNALLVAASCKTLQVIWLSRQWMHLKIHQEVRFNVKSLISHVVSASASLKANNLLNTSLFNRQ